jgi:Spy/CpxP family protein refolding chaperone
MSVTLAGVSGGRGVPRHWLLVAVLAISLALNACVVAGVLWSRLSAPETMTASERFRHLEESLNLDAKQRAAFESYVAATRARTAQLRRDIEPILEAAWAEIGKPNPDETTILQRLNDASGRWRTTQRETIEATLALLSTLSPDQRAKFIADEHERRAALRRKRADEAR